MKRPTFSLLFFVKRTRENKNGTLPIYVRITINGERAEFVIEKSIDEENWDSEFGRAKGKSKQTKEVNDYLDFIKYKLREHKAYMEEHKLTIKGTNTFGGDNSAFVDDVKTILRN